MKATAILVPPFGLLLAFTVYSPDADKNYKDKLIVDLAAAFPLHLQVCQLMEHGYPKMHRYPKWHERKCPTMHFLGILRDTRSMIPK